MTALAAMIGEAEDKVDRSAALYAVVAKGVDDGLSDEAIHGVAANNEQAGAKYGARLATEVDRILAKKRAETPRAVPATNLISEIDWTQAWSRERQEVDYVLDPLVPTGRVVTLFSVPKCGKSLLALEIGAQVATGGQMWGQELTKGHVTYVDAEMTEMDVLERLRDMGFGPDSDLSHLHYFVMQPFAALDTAAGGQELLRFVEETGSELVILDTQSKLVEGDENDSKTMTNFFRHTLAPLKRRGCTCLLLDHSGRDAKRGPRGTSQKPADVDAVWSVALRGADGLTLQNTHSRTRLDDRQIFLERRAGPLRHVRISLSERTEEVIDVCLDAIRDLDPPSDWSQNTVEKELRKQGNGFRAATVRTAYKRYKLESGT